MKGETVWEEWRREREIVPRANCCRERDQKYARGESGDEMMTDSQRKASHHGQAASRMEQLFKRKNHLPSKPVTR